MGFLDVVQVALDSGDDVWGWLVADFGSAVVFVWLGAVDRVDGLWAFGVAGSVLAGAGFARGIIEAVEEEDGAVHGAGDAFVGAGGCVGFLCGAGLCAFEDAVGEFHAFAEEVLAEGAELGRVVDLVGWGGRWRRRGCLMKHERIMNIVRIFVKGVCGLVTGQFESYAELCPSFTGMVLFTKIP
jgi:hypothetical protein